MEFERSGGGRAMVLVHGLGGSRRSWDTVAPLLSAEREIVVPDLPGHGASPPLEKSPTVEALAGDLEFFLAEHGLQDADLVGSSLGGRLVLELARRGTAGGSVVAIDPGGFWNSRELRAFELSLGASIKLVQAIQPAMPAITSNPVGRTALFAQLSPRPWALPGDFLLEEMRAFTAPGVWPTFRALVEGPRQGGGEYGKPLTIVWGRNDLVTLPRQAPRAARLFGGARLEWIDRAGHFPHWDYPERLAHLILTRS